MFTFGDLTNSVSASSAVLFAGIDATVTVNVAQDLVHQALGGTTGFFTVGDDALIWTAGLLTGSLTAGGNAVAVSAADANIGLNVGGDLLISTLGDYQGNVYAGGNAASMNLGGFSGSLTAGGHASVFTLEHFLGNVSGGGYVTLVDWGSAQGPATVRGELGCNAPILCTSSYESMGWVSSSAVCCWSEGVARTEAAHCDANSDGVR